jgi:hypothetical protein
VALTGTSALVFALVILGGPRLARLLFRQRLEAVRDDCMDEILNGRLRRDPAVDKFLTATARGAERAQWRTLPHLLALYVACVQLKVRRPAQQPTYTGLQPGEREIMKDLDARVERAYRSYLRWGSPLGWAQALLVLTVRLRHPRAKVISLHRLARQAMSDDTTGQQPERRKHWASRMPA